MFQLQIGDYANEFPFNFTSFQDLFDDTNFNPSMYVVLENEYLPSH